MQRAALTSTGNICLRCSGGVGVSSASRHISSYEVPSWISHRTIATGSKLSQASSPLATAAETAPTAFTGVKRSENWEEGWFEGNIHPKAVGGMVGAGGDTLASTSLGRGPYRGVAVKRVREAGISRAGGSGSGSWGGKNAVESVAVVVEDGGVGKAVAKTEKSSSEESPSSLSPPNPNPVAGGDLPEVDLPETTIRQPREPPDERTVNLGKSNPILSTPSYF